jgi:hypothetical protein
MKLEYSTVAKCRAEAVWAVFAESSRWSEWSTLLAGVHWLEGQPWQAGSVGLIELNQPAFKLKATVKESTPPTRVVWTGAVMGVNIECTFEFLAQPDNTTLMKAAIDLSGPGVFFINDDMKKKGLAAFTPWFDAMRTRSEQAAPSA